MGRRRAETDKEIVLFLPVCMCLHDLDHAKSAAGSRRLTNVIYHYMYICFYVIRGQNKGMRYKGEVVQRRLIHDSITSATL